MENSQPWRLYEYEYSTHTVHTVYTMLHSTMKWNRRHTFMNGRREETEDLSWGQLGDGYLDIYRLYMSFRTFERRQLGKFKTE